MSPELIQRGWQCPLCGDRIFSNYRHDFVACKCDAIYVDGGFDYFRAGFSNESGPGREITRTLKRKPQRGYRKR